MTHTNTRHRFLCVPNEIYQIAPARTAGCVALGWLTWPVVGRFIYWGQSLDSYQPSCSSQDSDASERTPSRHAWPVQPTLCWECLCSGQYRLRLTSVRVGRCTSRKTICEGSTGHKARSIIMVSKLLLSNYNPNPNLTLPPRFCQHHTHLVIPVN